MPKLVNKPNTYEDTAQPQSRGGQTSNESQLPLFIVMRLEGEDALIGCPKGVRGRCGNQFIVNLPAWALQCKAFGRNCPYCFKVSRIPPQDIIDAKGEKING